MFTKSKTPLASTGGRFASRRKTNAEIPSEFFVGEDGFIRKNSLNFFAKKKEAERIDQENQKMATRLLSQ